MKKILSYFIIVIIFGSLGYFAFIYTIPYIVLYKLKQRTTEFNISDNEFYHSPLIDASSRGVVRPNPDFLYSIAAYDVSAGPLKISGRIPDSTYWSISFYQNNTVNFYVKNDQQFDNQKVTLILVSQGSAYSPKENEEVIEAPTQTGVMLTRLLLPSRNEKTIQLFQELQHTFEIKLNP